MSKTYPLPEGDAVIAFPETPSPRLGSYPYPYHAGHSQPEDLLVHAVGKGWTVDGACLLKCNSA
jgi:hypothetical protein